MKDKTSKAKFATKQKGRVEKTSAIKDNGISIDKAKFGKVKPYIGPNDISWRTNDAVMTELVARLPFGMAAGLSHTINFDGTRIGTPKPLQWIQPGVLVAATKLTAGSSNGADPYNSATNLCFRKVYSYVRHANSGSKNYEAADMGMYFIAIGQALGLLGWLQRVLRTILEFSPTNRYTPQTLLSAMGCNYVDFIDHIPQLKYLVAWMGRAIGSLSFPDMPYFHACYEAYKYIIRDNDSPKEQYYILNCAQPGVYDPTYSSNGGGVKYATTTTWRDGTSIQYMTYSDVYSIVHEVLDVLLSDEDIGIIAGDILKAFKDQGLFKVTAFGEDYELFVKSEELLQQIHNAHFIGEETCLLVGYGQNAGGTNQAPFTYPDFQVQSQTIAAADTLAAVHLLAIDAFSREPDPKEVVNCTVLNPVGQLVQNSPATSWRVDKLSFDLHLPVRCAIKHGVVPNGRTVNINPLIHRYNSTFIVQDMNDDLAILSNFDWHPLVIFIDDNDSPLFPRVLGDIQNFRFFNYEVADRIHENSMLSLLNFKELNFY